MASKKSNALLTGQSSETKKKAPATPTEPGYEGGEFVWPTSGDKPQQVNPTPTAHPDDVGTYVVQQVQKSARWMKKSERDWSAKHPGGLPYPEIEQHKRTLNPIPEGLTSDYGQQTAKHPGIWKTQEGVAPEGDALVIGNKLIGKIPWDSPEAFEEELKPLEMQDLYRSYKSTPHAPASMLLKYFVHRYNHLADYDDPEKGHKLDVQFRDLVQHGGAAYKNGHVSIAQLHDWAKRWGPSIMPKLLEMRSKLQSSVARGIGLTTRNINGEPYVALTRGLDSEMMTHEQPLSSHADKPETGFGTTMHHSWVPLKDLWFSFDLGPKYSSDTMGPEDEWLVSNTGTRYEATPEDIKHHHIGVKNFLAGGAYPSLFNALHNDATDAQLAESARTDVNGATSAVLADHPGAGPLFYQAIKEQNPYIPPRYFDKKWVPREEALKYLQNPDSISPFALKNPNLTPEDLVAVSKHVLSPKQWTSSTQGFVDAWLKSPAMNSRVLQEASYNAPVGPASSYLLSSPLATPEMIQNGITNLQNGFYQLHPEDAADLIGNIAKNPHHTPEQAQQLYDWMTNNGQFNGTKPLTLQMSTIGKLNFPESVLRDLVDKSRLKSPQIDPEEEYQRATAKNILGTYIQQNPRAAPQLAKLVAEDIIPIRDLETRMTDFDRLDPELQPAFIRLAEKSNRPLAYLHSLAKSKGLTQDTINTLAHNSSEEVRDLIFRNKSVTPEQIREAYPKGLPFPEPQPNTPNIEEYVQRTTGEPAPTVPYSTGNRLADEIAEAHYRRRDFELRRAKEHLIKPLPLNLAKSEEYFWQAQARDWLSQQKATGFYYPTTRERALNIIRDQAIEPDLTDELLHGEAVFAYRDSPTFLEQWHKTAGPEDVVLYFETKVAPESHHDGSYYWLDRLPVVNAHIADTSAAEEPLVKFHTALTFPKLGIADNQRETKLVTSPLERKTFMRAAAAQSVRENLIGDTVQKVKDDPKYKQDLTDRTQKRYNDAKNEGVTIEGLAGEGHPGYGLPASEREMVRGAGTGQSAISAAFAPSATPQRKFGPITTAYYQDPRGLPTTAVHEDLHRIFARVQHIHGAQARESLTRNLTLALPEDLRRAVFTHLLYRRPDFGKPGGVGDSNEEAITELGSYLNSPVQRDNFHQKKQHSPEQQRAFHSQMKRAYRLLQAVAATADEKWLSRTKPWLRKGEASVPFHEVQSTGLSAKEAHEVFKASLKLSKSQPDLLDPNLFAFEYEHSLQLQDAVGARCQEVGLRKSDYIEDGELKSLYRQATKAFHPDLAVDDADRANRTEKLKTLNDIYRKRDIQGIREMLGVQSPTRISTPTGGTMPPGTPVRRPVWVGKSEDVALPGEDVLGPGEESAAKMMLGHRKDHEQALAAARFLTGRKEEVDDNMFRIALNVYDGDYQSAALIAVGLTNSEANLRALRAALKLGEFSPDHVRELTKAESLQPGTPHIESVVAGAPDAQDAADQVSRAVTAGLVQPLVLGGKHSKGSMAIRDPKTGTVLLIKPAANKPSPAKGIREDSSTQSAREAAFWHCAKVMELEQYLPRCDLLLINGAQVAAMKLLGPQWKNLDESNRKIDGWAREILTPYLQRGDLHRFAVMDWTLGQVDRHGQNLMHHAESIALIDEGSTFSAKGFNPGIDTKSFVPYYLRVFAPPGFSKKTPNERVKTMPVLNQHTDSFLRKWVHSIDPAALVEVMQLYGIGELAQKAVVERLDDLQRYDGESLSKYINELWAGLVLPPPLR